MAKINFLNPLVKNTNIIPTLKKVSANNTNLSEEEKDKRTIQKYNEIPDYNIVERLFDSSKNDAYNQKSSMQNDYNDAINRQAEKFFQNNNYTSEDIATANANKNNGGMGFSFKVGDANKTAEIENKAKEYGLTVNDLTNYKATEGLKEMNQKAYDYGKNNKTLGTALSVGSNLANGVISAGELVGSLAGQNVGRNQIATELGKTTNQLRSGAKSVIDSTLGNIAYDVATGAGDMGAAALSGGGMPLMAFNAFGSSLQDQKEKNTTDNQKILTAITSGAIEAATEAIPMKGLSDLFKNQGKTVANSFAKSIFKQMGEEAKEEAISEVANSIMDKVINGSESDYNNSVNAYISNGLSEKEAKDKALFDVVKNAGYSALIGGLTGGVTGLGASGLGKTASKINNVLNSRNNANTVNAENTVNTVNTVNTENDIVENIPTEIKEEIPTLKEPKQESITPQEVVEPKVTQKQFSEHLTEDKINEYIENVFDGLETDAEVEQAKNILRGVLNSVIESNDINSMTNSNADSSYSQIENLLKGKKATYNNTDTTNKDYFNEMKNNTDHLVIKIDNKTLHDLNMSLKELNNLVYTGKDSIVFRKGSGSFADEQLDKLSNVIPGIGESAYNNSDIITRLVEHITDAKNRYDANNVTEDFDTDSIYEKIADVIEDINKNSKAIPTETTVETKPEKIPSIAQERNVTPTQSISETVEMPESERTANASITSQNTYRNSEVFQKYEESAKFLEDEIRRGTYKVSKESEQYSLDKAARLLDENKAREVNAIENDKTLDNYQIDEAMMLLEEKIDEAVKTGDFSEVRRFSSMVNQKVHKVALGLQALAKHSRTAESAIMKTSALIEAYNSSQKNDANKIPFDVSNEDLAEVKRLYDEANKLGEYTKQRAELEQKANAILAKYLPDSNFADKWNAWRYLAMLGNPRTHIRNMVGNFLFGTTTNLKDTLAGAMENTLVRDPSKRTKSILTSADSDLVKASKEDANNVWTILTEGGNKYDMQSAIEGEKQIFKNRILEGIRNFNNDALTAEDNYALVNKYKRALASFLKAQGKDVNIFNSTNAEDVALLDEARKYAIAEAQKATFHEDNKFANWLSDTSRRAKNSGTMGKIGSIALESIVPFKKTPINVLKQGAVAYNPLQIFKGLYDVARNGNNPAKAIDEVARGLTGSAVMALGYMLFNSGILRGKGDDEESTLDYITNQQDYSINIDGNSYTIDWAAPTALPLFVGAELAKIVQNGDYDVENALFTIADPVIEMSMLQGIKNTIDSISDYSSKESNLGELAANIGMGYVSQGVPTVLGQVARSVDDTRRATYTGQEGIVDTISKSLLKQKNKIPGLSETSEPYINQWGETQENAGGSFLGRLAMNMLSPGYYANNTKDATENELYRLNAEMTDGTIGKQNIVPSLAEKTIDKQRLTPSELTEYAQLKGNNLKNMYDEVINTKYYDSLDDEGKANLLNKIMSLSNNISKSEFTNSEVGKTYQKQYDILQNEGVSGLLDYYYLKDTIDKYDNDLYKALESMNISNAKKGEYAVKMSNSSNLNAVYDEYGPEMAYNWLRMSKTFDDNGSGNISQDEFANHYYNNSFDENTLKVLASYVFKDSKTATGEEKLAKKLAEIPTLKK